MRTAFMNYAYIYLENMQKGTVPYYNVKSYLVYNICGICTIYTFKLRQFAKKLTCTRVTAYIFGISTRWFYVIRNRRTDYKPTKQK